MKTYWKPFNFVPYIILAGMALVGLISWWVVVAIYIGNITIQEGE